VTLGAMTLICFFISAEVQRFI